MKNYIQPGAHITAIATGAAVTSGQGVLYERLFGVAQTSAAQNQTFTLATEGVFELPKVGSQAWTVGAAVFWDNSSTPRRATTVGGNSNVYIGTATEAVSNAEGATLGRVKLVGRSSRRAAFVANASSGSAAEINALRDALVNAGLMAHQA